MAYRITWKPNAVRDLKNLPKPVQERIVDKIELAAKSPGRFLDWIRNYRVHKLRVGDYRVFVDLDNGREVVDVLVIRHRSRAYSR